KIMARKEGCTLYMVLLALTNILLSKLANQEDIVVGTPVAGRRHADLQQVIGMFVNTLALRNYPRGEKSVIEFLRDLKKSTLDAFENQEYPFEDLVEKAAVKRDAGRNPLFDVMFTLDNPGEPTGEVEGNSYEYEYRISKFDITLRAREAGEIILFKILYSTTLFKRDTIEKFIDYFKKIVSDVLNNNEIKLSEIEIIPGKQKKQVLYDFNSTETGYSPDQTIRQLFAGQVERTPDKIAAAGPGPGTQGTGRTRTPLLVTYRELNEQSFRLAARLRAMGIGPESTAAIMTEPTPEMIAAIFAVLKTGGWYLPIDPENPPGRINYMLKDSETKGLLTQKHLRHLVNQAAFPGETLIIEAETRCRYEPGTAAADKAAGPHDPVYMIYTSGTTGTPKGVLITNENLVNYVTWFTGETALTGEDKTVLTSSFAFDLGYTSIYPCCLQGGQLHILAKEIYMLPGSLLDYISFHRISYLKMTPSLFSTIADHPDFSPGTCRMLRLVVLGGEAINTADVEKAHRACQHIKIMNHYGPTEVTIGSIAQFIDFDDFEVYKTRPTIGRPIANTKVFILDKYMKLLPPGIAGELCISGAGVGKGYFKRESLTSEKFIPNTFMEEKPAAYPYHRVYRTGDRARWLPHGSIEFLGRIDQQVKIRGFRVELEEIQNHLVNHPGIKEAVVLAREDKYICAYIVPHKDQEPAVPVLREFLSKDLPGYMIPAYFVFLEKVPLTPNGKINRKALPAPQLEPGEEYTAPRNPLEKKLTEIWARVLEIEKDLIGIHHNFFQLGGHSLRAVILLSRIQKEFNVKIPLAEIFRTPTIKGLSGYMQEAAKTRYAAIEPVEKRDYYALSSAQQRLYILQQMDLAGTAYNMPEIIPLAELEKLDIEKLKNCFRKLIKRHESLRTSFEMKEEEPVQRVHDEVEFEIEYCLATEDTENTEGTRGLAPLFKDLVASTLKSFIRPFDLSRAPLLRVDLINKGEKEYILMIDMHHIISDGISHRILVTDFIKFYKDETLTPLPIQYKDFSAWQNSEKEKFKIKQQETYWLNRFEGEIPVLNIPTDYPRPRIQDFAGSAVSFEIPAHSTAALKIMARKEGCTLYMVLLA
ncbi:MAG: amino acid adenylation domain-containing protein, partial [Candidatus Aminicenantes bacterium]